MDQVKIGRFLSQLRKEKGLSQEALAEKIGVTNKTISRWETGTYMPDVEMMKILAEFFSISVDELLSGERAKTKSDATSIASKPTVKENIGDKKKEFGNKNKKRNAIVIIVSVILFVAICFFVVSCAQMLFTFKQVSSSDPEDYSNRFNVNLRFGRYAYQSYLGAFPRTIPDNAFFYYQYKESIFGVDYHFIYLERHFDTDAGFKEFEKTLSEFKIEYNGQINKPIYDEKYFDYPTYIFTCMGEYTYGVFEYIMLDSSQKTAVYVLNTCFRFSEIQKNIDYNITPKRDFIHLTYVGYVDSETKGDIPMNNLEYRYLNYNCNDAPKHSGFSVYSFVDENDSFTVPKIEELEDQFMK